MYEGWIGVWEKKAVEVDEFLVPEEIIILELQEY
jgi:hypothetical protein